MLESPVVNRIAHRQRDCSRCSVAELVNVFDHLRFVQSQLVSRRIDDSQVRLMRDEKINVFAGKLVALKNSAADLSHLAHGVLEDGLAFLMNAVHLFINSLVR